MLSSCVVRTPRLYKLAIYRYLHAVLKNRYFPKFLFRLFCASLLQTFPFPEWFQFEFKVLFQFRTMDDIGQRFSLYDTVLLWQS